MLRWQGVPASTSGLTLVREVKLVQLAELDKELPPGVPMATIETRRQQVRRRIAEHALRTFEG
jgi:hypothetical protein